MTFLSLGLLQPLQYKTRATILRGLVHLAPQLCWNVPCSGPIFAPCGKAEKLAKAQSPSSSENMHVYKNQQLLSSPHAPLSLSVKNSSFQFFMLNQSGPPAIMTFSSFPWNEFKSWAFIQGFYSPFHQCVCSWVCPPFLLPSSPRASP